MASRPIVGVLELKNVNEMSTSNQRHFRSTVSAPVTFSASNWKIQSVWDTFYRQLEASTKKKKKLMLINKFSKMLVITIVDITDYFYETLRITLKYGEQ